MATVTPTTPTEARQRENVVALVTSHITFLADRDCRNNVDLTSMQEILGRAAAFAFQILSERPQDEVLLTHSTWQIGESAIAAHRRWASIMQQFDEAMEARQTFELCR